MVIFNYPFNLIVPERLYDHALDRFYEIYWNCTSSQKEDINKMTILGEDELSEEYLEENDGFEAVDDVWYKRQEDIDDFFDDLKEKVL